ncbi:MAG TPA: HigA family addiction module antitoxin [Candidatus Saccharimonadales bacterium]|nr:HigA family addiction module antitoxin [Candidatus Saccharimonadales bacterium]
MLFDPAHPGEVLRDYLGEMTITEAATRLGVDRSYLSRILNGRAGVSMAMSARLSAVLGTSPNFWWKMQRQYDQPRRPHL